MRKLIYPIMALLVLASCGPQQTELEKAKAQLKSLEADKKDIEKDIAELTEKVKELDTDNTETVSRTLVTVIRPEKKRFVANIQVPGAADSRQNIVVSAESMGNVTNIYITEGHMVSKGQTIATIDSDVIRSQIAEMETRLELASEIFEKQQRLWEQKIGSELQFLQAKNNKESLEQNIKALKAQAAKTRITAPISGYVEEVMIREGQTVAMGTPAVRIVDLKKIRITADVSEKYIGTFTTKDSATVHFPSVNKNYKLKIRTIGQVVNSDNRTFTVEMEIDNTDGAIKPNVLADVTLPVYQKTSALLVPTSVIQQGKDFDYVYVAKDDADGLTAVKQKVQVGMSYDGTTEILDGLTKNDYLVALGSRNVADNEPIRVEE